MGYFMGDELCYIESMVKNLPSEKEEGVKALPFIEGGGVKRKIWSAY